MANAEPTATNQEIIVQGRFQNRKLEYAVTLTTRYVSWENLKSKTREVTSVALTDILAVKPHKIAEQHGIRIHYINKQANYVWKHFCMEFSSPDANQSYHLHNKMQQLHSNTVFEMDRPQKLLVYINPVSGGSKGLQIYRRYGEPLFNLAGILVETVVTDRAGHIKEHLAEYDTTKIDGVVVVGGDGTFTEAAVGLAKKKLKEEGWSVDDLSLKLIPIEIPIGIIPAGTGQGNVNRATGTYDITTAVLHILIGHSYSMDAFTVHDGSQLLSIGNLVCGFGFYSNWIHASEANRWLGRGRYVWGLAKTLSQLARFRAELDIELITRNEDGSIKKDSSEPDHKTVKGNLLEVAYFPYDFKQKDQLSGVICLHVFHEQTNRKKLMAHLSRMMRMKEDCFDFDFIEQIHASQYKIILDHSSPESQDTRDSAGVTLRTPTCINIDGDAYEISGRPLQVKVHPNIIRIFGTKHELKSPLSR